MPAWSHRSSTPRGVVSLVAATLLQGIVAGRFHIVPGASARFADSMSRHFPAMVRWMLDGDVKKAQTKPAKP